MEIGFTTLLTAIFITLKLLGKISWSWFWVLAPTWISIAFGISLFGVFLVIQCMNDK